MLRLAVTNVGMFEQQQLRYEAENNHLHTRILSCWAAQRGAHEGQRASHTKHGRNAS